MNYLFWFYVFLSCISIAGSAFYFYSKGQPISAGVMFVGLLIASLFFGLRWFPASGETVSTGPWPPVVNYCPDFLTLTIVNGEQVCVDTIGVAQTGGISKWSDPTQTDEKYLFKIFTTISGAERVKQLCDQAKTKKVTWEGLWDGSVCMGTEPPLPPAKGV